MSTHAGQLSLALLPTAPVDQAFASVLAQRLGLPLLPVGSDPGRNEQVDAIVIVSGEAVLVQQTGRAAPGPVAADFGGTAMRHRRRSGHNELLGKAVGVGKKQRLRVLDATAGLGRDSFVLADLGCDVLLCERDPVIVELLLAGMRVATAHGDSWLDEVLGRMRLCPGDAREAPTASLAGVDVIYLDPMFPQRTQSAAVKKEMALLQQLLPSLEDAGQPEVLLRWALEQPVARIVLKRPRKAPLLDDRKPSHSLQGKSIRFDVFVKRALESASAGH